MTEDDQIRLVVQEWKNVTLIDNPSATTRMLAILESKGEALTSIDDANEDETHLAISLNAALLLTLKHPSTITQMIAVMLEPSLIGNIPNPPEHLQKIAVGMCC